MKNFFPFFSRLHNSTHLLLSIVFTAGIQTITAQVNISPTVTATGAQQYCTGTPLNITTAFNITDPDDTTAQAVYIQISSGYVSGQDQLSLATTIPGVLAQWNVSSAKLSITGAGGQQLPYSTLINAVENVVYNNTSANPSAGIRTFSITLGDANYLPSTKHYYKFISSVGILWTNAKIAAENTTYYGLQGYLATLLSADEAQLCGEQATGTGWIGGSDAASEGVWKWMTGPEAGTIFWNGGINGSTPNFAFWNSGEPNNSGDEDYAHITAPGVGIAGSWNDLPNGGSGGGDYEPKGYVVEFGGMPGDPILNISASTTIEVVKLNSATGAARCGDGSVTLQAVSANNSPVYWYDAPTGGNLLASNTAQYTTSSLSETTTYYASAFPADCTTGTRTAVIATINIPPTLVTDAAAPVCRYTAAQLTATTSAGVINWYDAATGGTLLGTGSPFTTQNLTNSTTFYAEAVNNGCPASARQAITVDVLDTPNPQDENVEFCENAKRTISAGIAGMTYAWSTGETTESIDIDSEGTYTVNITNTAGCSAVKTITATTLPSADIIRIEVNTDVATAIMADPDLSNYEYALDNGPFKAYNVFANLNPGNHTIYARSINSCGNDEMSFAVYMIPKFFTPNGDNTNDNFTLAGMSAFPEATINIFDRYGQIVASLNKSNRTWDGTFNGNKLPATDYWYVIKLDSKSDEIKGHFSLIR
ncbi:T9SS type B sorting domain-containing protein [Flavobacterium sp. NRK1]|nr:T9SS type B sorting domain-containing protein [Flavobacterium sp. NRK1]